MTGEEQANGTPELDKINVIADPSVPRYAAYFYVNQADLELLRRLNRNHLPDGIALFDQPQDSKHALLERLNHPNNLNRITNPE